MRTAQSKRRSSSVSNLLEFFVYMFAVLSILGGCTLIVQRTNVETIEGTVTDKYIKRVGEADRFFVVLTLEDGETLILQNKDAFWWGKFTSADIQQDIELEKRYRMTVVGWRWPLLSLFQNIVRYEQLDE